MASAVSSAPPQVPLLKMCCEVIEKSFQTDQSKLPKELNELIKLRLQSEDGSIKYTLSNIRQENRTFKATVVYVQSSRDGLISDVGRSIITEESFLRVDGKIDWDRINQLSQGEKKTLLQLGSCTGMSVSITATVTRID